MEIPEQENRKKNPQKLNQMSSRSNPRHLVGKRTAQKDTIIDITSDSQVNSNFPYRWSPACLTFNNYFYFFIFIYNAPKITNEPKQKSRFETAGNKNCWGGGGGGRLELVGGRPTLALASALVHQTKQLRTTKTKRIKHKQEAKRAAGMEEQLV